MKILQVIHGLVPEQMGGSEVYTYNLSLELSSRHQVAVFYRSANPELPEYGLWEKEREGFTSFCVNHNFKDFDSFAKSYENPRIKNCFLQVMDRFQPDVVHVGHLTSLSTTIIDAARTLGVPVVFTLHDYWLLCPKGQLLDSRLQLCPEVNVRRCINCLEELFLHAAGSRARVPGALGLQNRLRTYFPRLLNRAAKIHRALLQFLFLSQSEREAALKRRQEAVASLREATDLFIAPSRFLRERFISEGMDRNKIVYCDYGFNLKPFTGFQRRSADRVRFGFLGSWIPPKGLDVLVKAFNDVSRSDAELHIHGAFTSCEGAESYPEAVRNLARHPLIFFHGSYDNDQVARVLAEIDVMVAPSIWYENSPLVIHEAFLARTPVIASRLGGMAELVEDGKNGLLFPRGDVAALTAQIELLCHDPDLRERLAKQAPPVKDMTQHAAELVAYYQLARGAKAPDAHPASRS